MGISTSSWECAIRRIASTGTGQVANVVETLGLADPRDNRAAAWGDYAGAGDLDLYVG